MRMKVELNKKNFKTCSIKFKTMTNTKVWGPETVKANSITKREAYRKEKIREIVETIKSDLPKRVRHNLEEKTEEMANLSETKIFHI